MKLTWGVSVLFCCRKREVQWVCRSQEDLGQDLGSSALEIVTITIHLLSCWQAATGAGPVLTVWPGVEWMPHPTPPALGLHVSTAKGRFTL